MSAAELFDAIRNGNATQVRSLLDAHPSLASAKNESGISAVLMSIYSGQRECRDLLLDRGVDLDLPEAAAVGNLERVRQLVQQYPDAAKSVSPDGFPVVALAAVFGHLTVVRYLAEHGADINAIATNGSGYSALTGAVTSGHTEMVQWLLEHGANPNHRYGPGYSPLLAAAANGHLEIVKLLLAHGADAQAVSNDGKNALAFAMERRHTTVADFLRDQLAASA